VKIPNGWSFMELDGTATVVGIKNVGDFTPMTKKLPPGFSDLRKNMIMIDYVTYMYMKKKGPQCASPI
jgi:hypothetical protein